MARRAKFVVTLNAASSDPVMVDYATADGTAVSGEDYTPTSGTLVFAPGETSKDVFVELRAIEEFSTEQFSLSLTNPVAAQLQDNEGVCVIPGVPPPAAVVLLQDTFTGDSVPLAAHSPDVGAQWYVQDLSPAPAPAAPMLMRTAAMTYSTPVGSPGGAGLELLSDALQVVSNGNPAHFKAVSTQGFGSQPDLLCEFHFKLPDSIDTANVDTDIKLLNSNGYGMSFYYRRDATQGQEEFRVFVWGQGIGTIIIAQDKSWDAPQYVPFAGGRVVKVALSLQNNNYEVFLDDSPDALGFYRGGSGDIYVPENCHVEVETNIYDGVSAGIELLDITVTTRGGAAVPGDGFADAFLDNFNDAPGQNILVHTPDLGDPWTVRLPNGVAAEALINGDSTDSGVHLSELNGVVVLRAPYLGQREFYIAEFDFTLLPDWQPGDAFDLYAYFTDGEQYTRIALDIYHDGTSVEFIVNTEGVNVGSASLDEYPFTGLAPAGQKNTVRIEVYPDHWRFLLNGLELINAQEILGLVDPRLELEFDSYSDSTVPYVVTRVRVADTPQVASPVLFAGDIQYTNVRVNVIDSLNGAAGDRLLGHVPDVGPRAEMPNNEPIALDGAGGISWGADTGYIYIGQRLQSNDYELSYTLKLLALPDPGTTVKLDAQAAVGRTLSVSYDSLGTLSWMVYQINSNTPGASGAIVPAVGSEHQFVLRETTRVVELLIDGNLVMSYDRHSTGEVWAAGQRAFFQLSGSSNQVALQLEDYSLQEYLYQDEVWEQVSQLLDTFQDSAYNSVTGHTSESQNGWTVQSAGGQDLVFTSNGGLWVSPLPGEATAVTNVGVASDTLALDTDVLRMLDYGAGIQGGFKIRLEDGSGWPFVEFRLSDDNGVQVVEVETEQGITAVPDWAPITTQNTRIRLSTTLDGISIWANGVAVATVPTSSYFYSPRISLSLSSSIADQAYQIKRVELLSHPDQEQGGVAPAYSYPARYVAPVAGATTVLFQDTFTGAAGALTAHAPETGGAWTPDLLAGGVDWELDGAGNLTLVPAGAGWSGDAYTSSLGNHGTNFTAEVGFALMSPNADMQFNLRVMDDLGAFYDAQLYVSLGDTGCRASTSDGQGAWIDAPVVNSYAGGEQKLRMVIQPTGWEIFMNDVSLGVRPAGPALNIAKALLRFQEYASSAVNRTVFTGVTITAPAGGVAPPAPPVNHTVLLLQATDPFVDHSTHAHPVTANGWDWTGSPADFGSRAYVNSGASHMDIGGDITDFSFDADFTIEFFAAKPANGSAGYDVVASTYTGNSAGDGWWLELSATRGFFFGGTSVSGGSAGGSTQYLAYAIDPNDNVRRHWALERYQGVLTMYMDGVAVASTAARANFVFPAGRMWIGSDFYNEWYNGKLDQFRVTKGAAVYQGNFAPPTAAFTA